MYCSSLGYAYRGYSVGLVFSSVLYGPARSRTLLLLPDLQIRVLGWEDVLSFVLSRLAFF